MKRRNDAPVSYDEVARRQQRKKGGRVVHLDDNSRIKKHVAIEVGPVVIERTVSGRYEWRDATLPPVRGARYVWWTQHGGETA